MFANHSLIKPRASAEAETSTGLGCPQHGDERCLLPLKIDKSPAGGIQSEAKARWGQQQHGHRAGHSGDTTTPLPARPAPQTSVKTKKKRAGGEVIGLLKYRAALRGLRNKAGGGEAPNLKQLSAP